MRPMINKFIVTVTIYYIDKFIKVTYTLSFVSNVKSL